MSDSATAASSQQGRRICWGQGAARWMRAAQRAACERSFGRRAEEERISNSALFLRLGIRSVCSLAARELRTSAALTRAEGASVWAC
jgi:hypothetical protein